MNKPKTKETIDKIKARINSALLEALIGSLVKEKQEISQTLTGDMTIYNKDVIYYLVMKLRSVSSVLQKIEDVANKELADIEAHVNEAKKSRKKVRKSTKRRT